MSPTEYCNIVRKLTEANHNITDTNSNLQKQIWEEHEELELLIKFL